MHVIYRIKPGCFGERREEVDEFGETLGDDTAIGDAWHAHHHRRMRRQLEVGVLAPLAVFACAQ